MRAYHDRTSGGIYPFPMPDKQFQQKKMLEGTEPLAGVATLWLSHADGVFH